MYNIIIGGNNIARMIAIRNSESDIYNSYTTAPK